MVVYYVKLRELIWKDTSLQSNSYATVYRHVNGKAWQIRSRMHVHPINAPEQTLGSPMDV